DGFTNTRIWLLSAIYFCLIAGLYGAGFWLPTLIKRTGVESTVAIGMLTVVPNAAAAIAMIVISRRSDRTRERRWHLVLPALINSIGNLAGFVGPAGVGWLTDRTGSTDFGISALAGVMAIGGLLVLTVPGRIVNR